MLGYLGSIGPLYDFKGYLNLLKLCLEKQLPVSGIVLTNNLKEANGEILNFNYQEFDNSIQCFNLSRDQVPDYLQLFSFLVSFCTISHSIIGASPTKIGEALSLGIPIISNSGVGDIDEIISKTKSGIIVEDTTLKSLNECLKKIELFKVDHNLVRESSRKFFDLENASDEYLKIYKFLSSSYASK